MHVDNSPATMVRELVRYRELLWQLAWRDIKVKYKQSVVGIGWAIFVPLMQTLIFAMIQRAKIMSIDTGNVPYVVFAYVGMVPWTFFQHALTQATTSLTGNRGLVTKIYFPREVFPLAKVLACVLDFAIAFVITFGLMLYYRMPLRATVVFVPFILLLEFLLTSGLGFFLAMGNLYYRDVQHIIGVFLRMWMFATAVIYPIKVSNPRLQMILNLNPMTPIINAYRDVVIAGRLPDLIDLGPAILAAVVFFSAGWIIFHRVEFTFADNV